jgi:hypothetical protein
MRNLVSATLLIASASTAALAQSDDKRPATPAPMAAAPFEAREAWCQDYVVWFIGETPAARPAPADMRPTHRLEVELNSCKLDPQEYERETLAEIPRPGRQG